MPKLHRRLLSRIFKHDNVQTQSEFDTTLSPQPLHPAPPEQIASSSYNYAGNSSEATSRKKLTRKPSVMGWRLNANIPGSIEYYIKLPYQDPIWAPPYVINSISMKHDWHVTIAEYHDKYPLPRDVQDFLSKYGKTCTDETRKWIQNAQRNFLCHPLGITGMVWEGGTQLK